MTEGLKGVRVLMINSICSQESFQLLFYFDPIQGVRKPELVPSMPSTEAKEQVISLLNVIQNCEGHWTQ